MLSALLIHLGIFGAGALLAKEGFIPKKIKFKVSAIWEKPKLKEKNSVEDKKTESGGSHQN